jgi:hypothetical protein
MYGRSRSVSVPNIPRSPGEKQLDLAAEPLHAMGSSRSVRAGTRAEKNFAPIKCPGYGRRLSSNFWKRLRVVYPSR